MNWITKNNYTIKRKFNQINRANKDLRISHIAINNINNSNIYQNEINFNINNINQVSNLNNNYHKAYYQINSNDALEQKLKKGEDFIESNLNCKYILSELKEF